MTTIIPRWEWRTFGHRYPMADPVFDAETPSATATSDETYFLSPTGANVKLRDALMDIKVLRETDGDGLERWEPILKAAFPLSAADLATVLASLGAAPVADGDGVSLERFREIIAAEPSVRPVDVHKLRVRYTIGGCMAERDEISANGRSTLSIAVESTDRAAVLAAVETLGLEDFLNVNYLIGIAALIDDVPARFAVIDVGTNSVKFNIGAFGPDGTPRTVVDRAEVTRLGEGMAADGAIRPEALERTVDAIAGMVEEAKRAHVHAIAAVGTEGLRQASNQAEVLAAIKSRTGLRIRVIAGDEEGRLAYLAAKGGVGLVEGPLVVFDTGGGSSQFTFGEGARVDERFSVPVGAARFTEQFRLDRKVSEATVGEAMAAIAAALDRIDGRPRPSLLIGMGGAITNITAVKHGLTTYDPDVVQGTILDRAEIDRQIELYRTRDADERRSIPGLQPKRAEVILAGACIVRTVMEMLGQDSLVVSDRGLRHGLQVERFGALEADE